MLFKNLSLEQEHNRGNDELQRLGWEAIEREQLAANTKQTGRCIVGQIERSMSQHVHHTRQAGDNPAGLDKCAIGISAAPRVEPAAFDPVGCTY
jgi:hypothetical protein